MANIHTFEEFCKNAGFSSYPFNSFTAEDEQDSQHDLFVYTKLYSPLFEAYNAGRTMIVAGDRGTGKTSITYDFRRRTGENALICYVDDFSGLNQNYSEVDFYKFAINNICNTFFREITSFTNANKKLLEEECILLSYFYINFTSDATRGITQRAINKIQIPAHRRALISLYNFIRNPLNIAGNVGTQLAADIISKSVGAQSISPKAAEYFPEIVAGLEANLPAAESTFEALQRLLSLIKKTGYERIIIIFDKIDEDARLNNAAETIAEYLRPFLTNNKFLLCNDLQVIVSTWVVPMNFIRDQVRTQKIYSPEIRWEFPDLKAAYNKRVKVFSDSRAADFDHTFSEEVDEHMKNRILELSNRNPRDLWHLMDKIFKEQYEQDAEKIKISAKAIDAGMASFVKNFNFYEYYPKKANAKANSMDVYAYIKHLLKLDAPTFTRNQLNEKAGTGSSTQNYTTGMENLGLTSKESGGEKGVITYRIRDPKVVYALENGIEIQSN